MNKNTYLNPDTSELVYFVRERGLWNRVSLIPSVFSLKRGRYTPAKTTSLNLGTIMKFRDLDGLEPKGGCIEYALENYSEDQRLLDLTPQKSRRRKIVESQQRVLDWIEGARKAIKV